MVTDVAGDLGLKIMLDRYAVKDMTRRSLAAGDTVIACVDTRTGQREISSPRATIRSSAGPSRSRQCTRPVSASRHHAYPSSLPM